MTNTLPSFVPTERYGQPASIDVTNADGEAAMEWFVEEILSREASSRGKNENPAAKVCTSNSMNGTFRNYVSVGRL